MVTNQLISKTAANQKKKRLLTPKNLIDQMKKMKTAMKKMEATDRTKDNKENIKSNLRLLRRIKIRQKNRRNQPMTILASTATAKTQRKT